MDNKHRKTPLDEDHTSRKSDSSEKSSNASDSVPGVSDYSDRIISACNDLNLQVKQSPRVVDPHKVERRRESNRLSARMRRKRRKEALASLKLKRDRLESESERLVIENESLKEEYQREIAAAVDRPRPESLLQNQLGPSMHLRHHNLYQPQGLVASSMTPFYPTSSLTSHMIATSLVPLSNFQPGRTLRDLLSNAPPPAMRHFEVLHTGIQPRYGMDGLPQHGMALQPPFPFPIVSPTTLNPFPLGLSANLGAGGNQSWGITRIIDPGLASVPIRAWNRHGEGGRFLEHEFPSWETRTVDQGRASALAHVWNSHYYEGGRFQESGTARSSSSLVGALDSNLSSSLPTEEDDQEPADK